MRKNSNEVVVSNPANHHTHCRQGAILAAVSPFNKLYSVIVAIPNLAKPVRDAAGYVEYYDYEVAAYHPETQVVGGIMLTPETTPDDVVAAHRAGARFIKNIPKDVSTNGAGIALRDLWTSSFRVFEVASVLGMPVLLHAQSIVNQNLSPFERDSFFHFLRSTRAFLPKLKISIEHANTRQLIDFVIQIPGLSATIAPHYALYKRDDVFVRETRRGAGRIIDPIIFCQPPYGDQNDRAAVIWAMTHPYHNGKRKFRYGLDDAPWLCQNKLTEKPASGVFITLTGPAITARIFEEAGCLDQLPKFMEFDAEFFGVSVEKPKEIILLKKSWTPPEIYEDMFVLQGGQEQTWQVK